LPTRQAGAQLPQPGGAAAQAAAAARIPRFSPPTTGPQPRQGSGPQPLPTRPANGAGAARGFSPPSPSGAPSPAAPASPEIPAPSSSFGSAGTGGFTAKPGSTPGGFASEPG